MAQHFQSRLLEELLEAVAVVKAIITKL